MMSLLILHLHPIFFLLSVGGGNLDTGVSNVHSSIYTPPSVFISGWVETGCSANPGAAP